MYKFIIAWILLMPAMASAQDRDVYAIYEQQYRRLLNERGVSETEISKILKTYSASNIKDDKSLAELLGKIYSGKKGIALLFYFFNNDTLRRAFYYPGRVVEVKSMAITKDRLIGLKDDINSGLNLYNLARDRSPLQRGNITISKPASHSSYKKAVGNAARILLPDNFSTSIKHLVIVPALNIGTIPFHLLPVNGKDLIEQCSFTVVPSLVDMVALRTRILKKNISSWDGKELPASFDADEQFSALDKKAFHIKKALLVSNPAYPKDSVFSFPDLPGAEKEVLAAIPYAEQHYLLKGSDAKKATVKQRLQDCNLAWFATHGIADQQEPMTKSFLVLGEPEPYLTAKEIMQLHNYSGSMPEMVILSACQTGLGKSMEAGTAGLARSFLLGGSSHVIMSLWNVDDEATAYFMSRFVYYLQQEHPFMPSEQLRLATLDTRKKFSHPSKWASFSLFGIDY